jgi:uncharacterized membrane protein
MAVWVVIFATSFYTATALPENMQLPIHWNIHFEPDNWSNKWVAILMLPGVSLAITVLFKVIPLLEPRANNLEKSEHAYRGVFWAVQLFFLIFQIFIFSFAWEWNWEMPKFLSFAVGMLLAVVGNFLGKTRSTYLFGIRTTWTLSSELVWRKTHRLAGFSLFVIGLLLVASTPWANEWTLFGGIAAMLLNILFATLYSYILWKSLNENSEGTQLKR